MRLVPILEVAGSRATAPMPFEGARVYYATADVDGSRLLEGTPVTFRDRPSRANLVAEVGDVLFAKMQGTNKVVHLQSGADDLLFSTGFFNLRPDPNRLDPNYLAWFLRSAKFQAAKDRFSTGAIQKALTLSGLKNISIPVPDNIAAQRRIAGLLDTADSVRRRRAAMLLVADEFVKSSFLNSFGDPVLNPNNFPTVTLGEITKKITDGEHQNPEFTSAGMPIVMAQQVQFDRILLDECKFVSMNDGVRFRRKCGPEDGDILIVGRGATIGRCCVVDTKAEFCLMGSVILVKPNLDRVQTEYLHTLLTLKSIQARLITTSSSSAQQAIYLKHLKDMPIPLPPLELQRRFAQVVGSMRSIRERLSKLHTKDELLLRSVIQRAFDGRL